MQLGDILKQTVHPAVLALELRLQTLMDMRSKPQQELQAIAQLDAEIEQADRELAHYRNALKLEQDFEDSAERKE